MIDRCRLSSAVRPLALLFALSAVACAPERPQWPDEEPDIIDVTLVEGTVQPAKEITDVAKVEAGRLSFPRNGATDAVAAWPVGKAVIGAAATNAGNDNPVGFLRKVKSVNTDGENVIVETEPATLQDVFVGKVKVTTEIDNTEIVEMDEETTARFFPEVGAGPGLPPPTDGQPLSPPDGFAQVAQPIGANISVSEVFNQTVTMPIFNVSKSRTYGRGGRAVTVNIQGTGALASTFDFKPRLTLAFEAGLTSGLDEFLVEASGDLTVTNTLTINVGVTAASGTEPTDLVDLETLLEEGPELGSLPPVVLARSAPRKGPVIAGIPTTFRLVLLGDCNFGIQASMYSTATATMSARNVRAGMKYTDRDGWQTISNFEFGKTATASIGFGGGVGVECGLTARVEWLVGDVGGPYLGVRGSVNGFAAYADQCNMDEPYNGRPDAKVVAKIGAKVELQVGGKVDAWKIVKFEKGPYNIYEKKFDDLWTYEKTWEDSGLGYCFVDCDNKLKTGDETDTDCGGPNCRKCLANQGCTANGDCLSGGCNPNGQCAASTCEDGQKGQQETDVDCGGPLCPRCNVGQGCTTGRDCSYGLCTDPRYGPQTCTDNWCLDGVVSGGESDVDCGLTGGCTNRCAVGQACTINEECASGVCHVGNRRCVASYCEDGRRSGDETGVDCGGSCATKCALGIACNNNRGGADCASGFCSNQNTCVASIHLDGFANGGETGPDCGGIAPNRCGLDNNCNNDSDCEPGNGCSTRTRLCTAPGCNDVRRNGEETSIDCGGSRCEKCGLSKSCLANTDCVSNLCSNNKCVASLCDNDAKDPGEADVDCGITCGVKKCATGKACTLNTDCASEICAEGRCTSDPCRDRFQNGTESDVDCGGSCSAKCVPGKRCNGAADCASGTCNSTTQRCVGGPCEDGVKNGSEADVDCGGSCGNRCAVNKACASNGDCASGTCNLLRNRCVPDACFDGVKNGSETDTDCGGACPAKCGPSLACVVGTDCQSGACMSPTLTCATDQCSDGRLNGNETGVDCGGSCATDCAVGLGCLTGDDCLNPQGLVGVAGYCNVASKTCTSTSCGDGIKSGDESGNDCGGSCAATCANGDGCTANRHCTSTFCNLNTQRCVASACENGVKDGTETGLDCGGFTPATGGCGGCGNGEICTQAYDCGSATCGENGRCVERYPMSCKAMYDRNGPGDRVDGAKQLDIDGPYYPSSPRAPNSGTDNPIVTYCDMSGGGWTPVVYMNSESPTPLAMRDDRPGVIATTINWDPNRNSWALTGPTDNANSCVSDAQCNSRYCDPGQSGLTWNWQCPSAGAAKCQNGQCIYTRTRTALPSHPANYSVAKAPMNDAATMYPPTYVMNLTQTSLTNLNEFKWQVFRHGQLLYTIGPFAREMRLGFGRQHGGDTSAENSGNGYLYTPAPYGPLWNFGYNGHISTGTSYSSPRANINWLRANYSMLFSPFAEGFPAYNEQSTSKANGWAGLGDVRSVINIFSGTPRGFRNNGFWAYWRDSAVRMGACNDLDNYCGAIGVKSGVQSVLTSGEASMQPGYGGEYENTAGLVFVLWAK